MKHEDDRGAMPPPTAPVKRTVNAKAKPQMKDDDDDLDFDELLENLRNRKHEDDDYDESQVRQPRVDAHIHLYPAHRGGDMT